MTEPATAPATAPAYDNENIFAKILRGEIPSHKVYEDEATIAIMDIMPRADGHTLVIPKTPSRNLLDVEPADLGAVMETAQKIARAHMIAFNADGVTVNQFNESAGGQVIFHLHVHVIPRKEGEPLGPHTGEMADNDLLASHAAKIREALKSV
ncbi:histidine triad (HIT) family protein [Cohaesibacter sp. ES.047]|uniref:HIT family protein n=1 Tax=Cohaesibacter sp. ES.047 TaxID=1798205 RepID=UPI000BB9379D|nr:HIT family protein [Cohaesibacter sp. ES.047]SNY93920.1 histidine triad (HIT) family protein [Cohaesibacter sp. ES.047]